MANFRPFYQDITPEEVEETLRTILPLIPSKAFEIVQRALQSLGWILTEIKNCQITIRKLNKIIWGGKTENIPFKSVPPKNDISPKNPDSKKNTPPISQELLEKPSSKENPVDDNNQSLLTDDLKKNEEEGIGEKDLTSSSSSSKDCGNDKNNLSSSSNHSEEIKEKDKDEQEPQSKNKKKNHGRNGLGAFTISKIVHIPHATLCPGDSCPECRTGKLYTFKPQVILRIEGNPPMQAKAWAAEGLRCNACQKIFRATFPKEVQTQSKADFAAKSIVCLLKYQGGVPLYRMETIQKTLGVPISDSEMWEWTEEVALILAPVHKVLMKMAANAPIIHHDDTKIKILEIMKENKEIQEKENSSKSKKDRVGMFTTSILAKLSYCHISLYISGRKNAGENLDDLLDQRQKGSKKPIQAADASPSNNLKKHESEMSKCLVHARRKFHELLESWPQESLHNIQILNQVFMNDRKTKSMSPEDRKDYHKKHSEELLKSLKAYNQKLIDEKKVEPNSDLGKAINYFNNHWEGLTLFLRNGEAPLSNNDCERSIKRKVLIRKNSYFYKTLYGSLVGDILLSVIQTCCINKVNPYDYLNAIQANAEKASKNPEEWTPWEYEKRTRSLLEEVVLEKEGPPTLKEEQILEDKKEKALLAKGKIFIQKCADFFRSRHHKPKQVHA